MDYSNFFLTLIIIACVTSLAVEIEKKIFIDFPNNLLVFVTSTIFTVIIAIAYMYKLQIAFGFIPIVAIIILCIVEGYIAMFGYDKFIQTLTQYKDYLNSKKEEK